MSIHSDTSSIFRVYQSVLLLFNAACFVEKRQIPILVFDLIQPGLEHTTYHTRGKHANHYTTDEVFLVEIESW